MPLPPTRPTPHPANPLPRGALIALLGGLVATPALANDTAIHLGRYGPGPVGGGYAGPESAVAMVREHLAITLGRRTTRVVATFTFRNSRRDVTLTQLVGFPDEALARAEARRKGLDSEGQDIVGPLRHLTTSIDGVRRPSQAKHGWVRWRGDNLGWEVAPKTGMPMAWHTLAVAFPPGKDVVVERRYETDHAANTLPSHFFEYITHTGGPWHGPIGQLVADVTLIEGLRVDDLYWPGRRLAAPFGVVPAAAATSPGRRHWRVLGPSHIQLRWQNFEPRTQAGRQGFKLVLP